MRAEVDFTFGEGTRGHLSMDWNHKGEELREIALGTTQRVSYRIDLIQGQLFRDGVPVLEQTVALNFDTEYTGIYHDFVQHIAEGRSNGSTRELRFVRAPCLKPGVA